MQSGDVIAEIETDKAIMEVEAVDEGTIGKVLVVEGTEHVPVNQPIALLITEEDEAGASSVEARPTAAFSGWGVGASPGGGRASARREGENSGLFPFSHTSPRRA